MLRRFLGLFLCICILAGSFCTPVGAEESSPQFEGTLRISADGIEMLKDLEGFVGKPKHDVSQYSIGYGCSTTYAKKYGFSTEELTKDEATQLMLFVLEELEGYLDTFLNNNNISVNQFQYDALISLTYNLGRSWLSPTSRLGELLVNGNYTVNELASAFGIYCHTGTGKNAVVQDLLVSRRIRETKLFLYGAYDFDDVEEKFCRLTYKGNVPPGYTDVAIYQQGMPYQILFEPNPSSDYAQEGLYFIGWYDEYGEKITADTIVTDNITVEPRWSNWPEEPELESQWFEYYSPEYWPELTEKTYINGCVDGEASSDTTGDGSSDDNDSYYTEVSAVFSDMNPEAWYYEYVNDLYNNGVINGYEDRTFRPERTVTIGEALKMILLASGYAEPEPVTQHWASGYHYMALDFGIIDQGEVTDLDVPITRALMAKITANALSLYRLSDYSVYLDTDNEYACILFDWGITEGYEDGTFRPDRSLTRAELSTIVWRINNYLV